VTKRGLTVRREDWPIAGSFTISRGSRTQARVILVEIESGGAVGRGEGVPYARYGESLDSVEAQIASIAGDLEAGMGTHSLQDALPAGAARNAVDCALWDLEAKRTGARAFELAGLPEPAPVETAYTLSLGTPEAMGEAARAAAHRPLLKLKLTGDGDLARVAAVRHSAPQSRLIVDANEAWTMEHLAGYAPAFARLGVELIEQPLPAAADGQLAGFASPVTLCADESCHDLASLPALAGRYGMVNIKLDKTGGLTEALRLKAAARAAGYKVMVGCMLGTSLAMAPALLVAQGADVVDLDGPLLLARDREPALRYDGALAFPPEAALWG
jgi:L-alanine-DL-glutamate epimerase-like enolase superfamily enzyme